MNAMLLQAGLSLAAILALFALAAWLGLGRGARIRNEDHARDLAREADSGFAPRDAVVGEDGTGALVRGADGRLLAIKLHGARFAARPVGPDAIAVLADGTLAIECGDRRFGRIVLPLRQPPPAWLMDARAVD